VRTAVVGIAVTLGVALVACRTAAPRSAAPPLPPAAASLAGHLSPLEERHLARIRAVHEGGGGIIQKFRQSGLLADSAQWWVAGPPEVLPFAGTWRGLDGMAEFTRRLDETMRYDRVELREYLVSGDNVAAIFVGEGIARATGRPFHSEIVRLYTFSGDKVVRVRNFYDTAAYVAAVRGSP
jgi:ketosteroid isomerase-like protein